MKPGTSDPARRKSFPRRGEVYWVALDPTVGREIRKTRPALVVSPDEMNQALEKLQIHPVIDTVYSFTDALAAYDHLYRGAFGKIVIRVRE